MQEIADPSEVGWEPMPEQRPAVLFCRVCQSVPLWRHALRCTWLVCPKCGISTPAFRNISDVAKIWNMGVKNARMVDAKCTNDPMTDEELLDSVAALDEEEESGEAGDTGQEEEEQESDET